MPTRAISRSRDLPKLACFLAGDTRDIATHVFVVGHAKIGRFYRHEIFAFASAFGFLNPHGYRFCGLQGPAFVSFGKISISPSLQTMGESWILSRNQKNASFREQIRKLGTWGGSGAATKLQSRANWKKTDFFLPLQALEEHNSQATSIQNLGIFFLVVYYMPNLSSK